MDGGIQMAGGAPGAQEFLDSVQSGRFLFALVASYTETAQIPGITVAGANPEVLKYTPPADAEYLHYGYCKSIDGIPMTPDGKPTPALLTKVALEASSIPHFTISAGSAVQPQMPFIHTGLPSGRDISQHDAMDDAAVARAVDYGRIVGRSMAPLTDCLVIGESLPGGTTTALAVLRAMGLDARVSSSMPDNPAGLKDRIVAAALARLDSDLPFRIVAQVGDPMIPFVAGMISSASDTSAILLAGGTQMAAVLAFAGAIGSSLENVAIGTTSYVVRDPGANLVEMASQIGNVPVLSVDPLLDRSARPGLEAFSRGFAKEGAGAGGCIISSMLKSGHEPERFLNMAESEYDRIVASR